MQETAPQCPGCGGRCRRRASGAALVTLVLDQAHKWWMLGVYGIADKGRVAVTPFLDLVFVKNTGISYSLFDQSSTPGSSASPPLRPSPPGALGLARPRGHRQADGRLGRA